MTEINVLSSKIMLENARKVTTMTCPAIKQRCPTGKVFRNSVALASLFYGVNVIDFTKQ